MDIISHLIKIEPIKSFVSEMEITDNMFTMYPLYKHIDCKLANLSVQIGEHAYCSPRATLDNLEQYTTMELAIVLKDGDWAGPSHPMLINFHRRNELYQYYDGSHMDTVSGSVYAYVPVDLIQDLYKYLK